ncbi:MAG: hypothetical protein V4448_05345 [Pseudomonadota bacterium]
MEGGKEQNFWPGFVDALSNVVLVMIFVVVVFVVTLFYYSQKLAQFKAVKFMEKKELQEQVATPSKNQPNISRLDDGKNPDVARFKLESQEQIKEIAALKGQVALLQAKLNSTSTSAAGSLRSDEGAPTNAIQIEKTRTSTAVDTLAGIKIDGRTDAITLRFDKDGVELNNDATKTLDANIKGWTDKIKSRQGKLVITGVVGSLAYTEGRRRAYYRTIAVRNYLIDLGVAPTSVISRVVPGNESAESDSTVVIQYSASAK